MEYPGERVGHEWKYAFTDFQLSGFNNSFEEMDIGFPGVEFSGESSGLQEWFQEA